MENRVEIIEPNRDKLWQLAADALWRSVQALNREQVVIALPGGRSVAGLVTAFLDLALVRTGGRRIRIVCFLADERCVPLDSEDSNFRVINQAVQERYSKGNLGEVEFILEPFQYRADLPDWGTEIYAKSLAKYGGRFDVTVVSSGEDGHIASLFPNHPSWIDLTGNYTEKFGFLPVDHSPKPPPRRISASPALITNSSTVFILFIGTEKQEPYNRFLAGEELPSLPAALVRHLSQLFIVTDLKD